NIPGLRDAEPVVLGRITLPQLDKNGRSVWLFGLDRESKQLRDAQAGADNSWGIDIHWIDNPANPLVALRLKLEQHLGRIHVLVGDKLAQDLKEKLPDGGNQFQALAASKRNNLTLLGTVHFKNISALGDGNFVVMDVGDAASLIFPQRRQNVSQINLYVEPGANPRQVRQAVKDYVGDRAEVRNLAAIFEPVRDVTGGLELGFDIGGAIALVVGLFLVYNVLSVSVAERRHDIGILRSVGATRGQVAGLFLGEAALLGLVGSS